jgi:hypothetical protein
MERVMNTGLGNLKSRINSLVANRKVRNALVATAVILFVLQLYFVQELIAAELLFGMAFIALFLLGGLFYTLGAIGERSFDLTEAGVRVLAVSARRGYAALEEISRKPFRHPRSESAQ